MVSAPTRRVSERRAGDLATTCWAAGHDHLNQRSGFPPVQCLRVKESPGLSNRGCKAQQRSAGGKMSYPPRRSDVTQKQTQNKARIVKDPDPPLGPPIDGSGLATTHRAVGRVMTN